MQLNEVNLVA